jgi:hypothetical protein
VVTYWNWLSDKQTAVMGLKNHSDNQSGLGTISNTRTTLVSSYMASWLAMEQEYNKRVFPFPTSSILHHVLVGAAGSLWPLFTLAAGSNSKLVNNPCKHKRGGK